MHPECAHDVVELADRVGSTERILAWVEAAEPGSVIGVGTEIHMVQRMAAEHPDTHGRLPRPARSARAPRCSASTARTSRGCSSRSSQGEVVNQITVDERHHRVGTRRAAAHARHHLRRRDRARGATAHDGRDQHRAAGWRPRRGTPCATARKPGRRRRLVHVVDEQTELAHRVYISTQRSVHEGQIDTRAQLLECVMSSRR